jgi:hypothetical protein
VIGNGDTILPLDAETGEQLYHWTCWPERPATPERQLEKSWNPEDDRAAWLCDERRDPRPEGDQQRRARPADPEPASTGAN